MFTAPEYSTPRSHPRTVEYQRKHVTSGPSKPKYTYARTYDAPIRTFTNNGPQSSYSNNSTLFNEE